MNKITYETSFKHYKLYDGIKNKKGFYLDILEKIDLMFNFAMANYVVPMVGHIIVDKSINYRINQVLSRIIATEAKTRKVKAPKFSYISVVEKRKKDDNFHQHLAIVLESGDYNYFKVIQLELRKYSRTSKVTLAKRRHDSRPDYIDPLTGEVKKLGSAYLHSINKETLDAFQRISYIAKVETKISPKFSSSRI